MHYINFHLTEIHKPIINNANFIALLLGCSFVKPGAFGIARVEVKHKLTLTVVLFLNFAKQWFKDVESAHKHYPSRDPLINLIKILGDFKNFCKLCMNNFTRCVKR